MRNNVSRSLVYISLSFLIVSCLSNTNGKQDVAAIRETLPIPVDSPTFYFPIDSTDEEPPGERSVEFMMNSWYSKMLFALREPVLYNYAGEEEIYRFTWLRTFDNPVAVRVQKQGDSIRLFAKVAGGAGGYEPGQIKMDTAFLVSKNQWKEWKELIARVGFWNLPTESNEYDGKDGSQWILEGVSNKQYHWVDRWTPNSERYAEFKELCEYLLNLSKVPTHANRGYY